MYSRENVFWKSRSCIKVKTVSCVCSVWSIAVCNCLKKDTWLLESIWVVRVRCETRAIGIAHRNVYIVHLRRDPVTGLFRQ